ncbi:hypothetical protein ABH926_009137 [Catenulispora sp. GP43]|uniref:hypothetical protein n=1 Tax=Catenulispora sp. GP43 TaxID=3156263 RepID=UPI00351250B4
MRRRSQRLSADGNQAVLAACKHTAAQKWTHINGALTINGGCMHVFATSSRLPVRQLDQRGRSRRRPRLGHCGLRIGKYQIYVSDWLSAWGSPVATGAFPDT